MRMGKGGSAMDLSIEAIVTGSAGDKAELVARGRIDAETAAELEAAVDEQLRLGRHTIRLDLGDVGFLSSAGIRALFNVHRAAKGAGGSCLVSRSSEPIHRVLTLSRLAPLLMEPGAVDRPARGPVSGPARSPAPAAAPLRTEQVGEIVLVGFDGSAAATLEGIVVGAPAWTSGLGTVDETPRNVPREAFGIGIGALADDGPAVTSGGELVAACGSVFVRPPRPFGVPDSLVGRGDLVPTNRLATGLFWEGTPRGHTGFEGAEGGPVALDRLLGILLDRAGAEALAILVVAEVLGLVGAELIRPVAEATADDHPAAGRAEIAARWLSFSREPCHSGRTALVVGVATRGARGALGDVVRPFGAIAAHLHAAVFPHRPLRRGVTEPEGIVAGLGGMSPLAVMHLLADPAPVLGSGRPELVRGACWFAPIEVRGPQR
jgi:anti-anti-sigma factor